MPFWGRQIIGRENKPAVARDEAGRAFITKGQHEGTSGMMKLFHFLMMMVVTEVIERHIKSHRTVCPKKVYLIAQKFYKI